MSLHDDILDFNYTRFGRFATTLTVENMTCDISLEVSTLCT